MLEAIKTLQRLEDRLLDQVGRVGDIARPAGQTTMRPATQHRQVPFEQLIECLLVAGLRTIEQVAGLIRGIGGIGRWRNHSRDEILPKGTSLVGRTAHGLFGRSPSRVSPLEPGPSVRRA